ncbi:GL14876 [Drosophila persimilis]|uniref:GL14876 n=1 Tax=Drosophila persimilis TaxID=7234 RepID=B4H0E2_DROPE|nr:GL14876 [Drosophila persimilis]
MSKDYEYEYNRKQKVWDPNERHTREDTLTEGVVGLVGIVGVTAIVTGLASKKVRSNIAKIFGRPPAAPKPGPRAPRPLLRTLNPLCTSPYDKKSSTASGNEPIQPLKLTASTFDRQAPAAEAEEQLTEEEAEAEATKAANSLLARYLNASVDQYPKHPIDWSEGCAKAKLTTALRFRSIVAPEEQPLAPVTDSSTPSSPCGSAQLASLKLAASHFDQQEQNITEEEAVVAKASDSLLNRYLNASVGQYPKHPIDWSEGCAKAKLTTALRLGSIEAEQAPLPVPESSIPLPTTQVVNLFKNSNLVAAEISRLETSKNLEQFAETQRPTVTPETLELTVPGTVEVTEIETANTAVTTGNADIAATCVKADITDPTVNEDITASAVKTGITVPTANAAITASAVKADITTAAVKADIATPAAKADLTAPAVKADITATGGNAKITATSEEADITNTAEKANKTTIAGKEDITESSKLSERVQ